MSFNASLRLAAANTTTSEARTPAAAIPSSVRTANALKRRIFKRYLLLSGIRGHGRPRGGLTEIAKTQIARLHRESVTVVKKTVQAAGVPRWIMSFARRSDERQKGW